MALVVKSEMKEKDSRAITSKISIRATIGGSLSECAINSEIKTQGGLNYRRSELEIQSRKRKKKDRSKVYGKNVDKKASRLTFPTN